MVWGSFPEANEFAGYGDVLAGDADVAAADFAMRHQLRCHGFRGVDRHGEAEILGVGNDGGVDAHDGAAGIDQGAAGVAGVEGGIGLDDIVDEPAGLGAESSADRGDDACGYGCLESQRVADGDYQLTGFKRCRVAEFRGSNALGGIDADHRQVRVRVFADQCRPNFAARLRPG